MSDGTLKVRVAAVPEGGKANEELRRLLAQHFAVPLGDIEILAGHSGTRKTIRVQERGV